MCPTMTNMQHDLYSRSHGSVMTTGNARHTNTWQIMDGENGLVESDGENDPVESDDQDSPTPPPDGMIIGENGALAWDGTNDEAVNFFFNVVNSSPMEEVLQLLDASWNKDPELTLRLVFQLGNVREGGKMETVHFRHCLAWLWRNHPETVLLNLRSIQINTYLKDLLQILEIAMYPTCIEDTETKKRKITEQRIDNHNKKMKVLRRASRNIRRDEAKERFAHLMGVPLASIWKRENEEYHVARLLTEMTDLLKLQGADVIAMVAAIVNTHIDKQSYTDDDIRMMNKRFKEALLDEMARCPAHNMPSIDRITHTILTRAKRESERMVWDPAYKQAWNDFVMKQQEKGVNDAKSKKKEVTDMHRSAIKAFMPDAVQNLTRSIHNIHTDNEDRTNLAQYDDITSVVEGQRRRLFDGIVKIFVDGLSRDWELYTKCLPTKGWYGKWAPTRRGACDKATNIVWALRKALFPGVHHTETSNMYRKMLSTLRGAAMIPEHFVGGARWHEVDYDRMASRCRHLFGNSVWAAHDEVRYVAFLERARRTAEGTLEEGEKGASVAVGAIFPHEVTGNAAKAFVVLNKKHDSGFTEEERQNAKRISLVHPHANRLDEHRTTHTYRLDQHKTTHTYRLDQHRTTHTYRLDQHILTHTP
jgi:hypothetical protein